MRSDTEKGAHEVAQAINAQSRTIEQLNRAARELVEILRPAADALQRELPALVEALNSGRRIAPVNKQHDPGTVLPPPPADD